MSPQADGASSELCPLLERLAAGDQLARDALVERTLDRLRLFVRAALADSPKVRRWEQSDDITQTAAVRLWRALEEVRPATPEAFFGLCSEMIRRTMIDLIRKYFGPEGIGRYHDSPWKSGQHPAVLQAEADSGMPSEIENRLDIHEAVEKLGAERRAVVDLLFYQGMSMYEAAQVLGLSEKSVSRRWRAARIALARHLRSLSAEEVHDENHDQLKA